MSKFTSSVSPASSLEEARDLAFGEHRERIKSVAVPLGFANVNWKGKSIITYVYRVGEKFVLSKMARPDLRYGNLMDPDGGPWTGQNVTLEGGEIEGLAAIVLTLVESYRAAEFGYRVIFQMWAEDYQVPVYVRISSASHHWANTIWEHTATDCRVVSPKGEEPCETPENRHGL